jgi:hypothetical protein
MPDLDSTHPAADAERAVARELLAVLPFGVRPEALARCPRLVELTGDGHRAAAAVVAAIESLTAPLHIPDQHPDPLPAAVVRPMLHVLLASKDLGWPRPGAPIGIRRVAAADLFFDATQTVLSDSEWKGPHGVEFALLRALAARIVAVAPARPRAVPPEVGGEMLGHLHRVRRPRGS